MVGEDWIFTFLNHKNTFMLQSAVFSQNGQQAMCHSQTN